jgi:hypothetical protein
MQMKRLIVITMILAIGIVSTAFAFNGKLDLKMGDERYVCSCGEKCPCDYISKNPGNCTCGRELIKAKVTKVADGKAYFMAAGWAKERAFKTTGKYACNCGTQCPCNSISQNPGKCTCGVEMSPVKF